MSRFASFYDLLMLPSEILRLRSSRRALVRGLLGKVIEVGVGTGANMGYYPVGVGVVYAVDPDPAMLVRARRRASGRRVRLVRADAQRLPFAEGMFDAAVAGFVFCSVSDPNRGLAEVHRVVRMGGELRLLEHVEGPRPGVAWLQHRLDRTWRRLFGGCSLCRRTPEDASRAGFESLEVRRVPGPYPGDGLLPSVLIRGVRGVGQASSLPGRAP